MADKPKPDFSDVKSGSSSTAPPPAAKPEPPPATAADTYVVVAGDTLSHIAKRLYGKASEWRKIHEANRDLIENPDVIRPGQRLKIPR